MKPVPRWRRALRTNDTQFSTVVMLTLLTLYAMLKNPTHEAAPWWVWPIATGGWPLIAYLANLWNPLP